MWTPATQHIRPTIVSSLDIRLRSNILDKGVESASSASEYKQPHLTVIPSSVYSLKTPSTRPQLGMAAQPVNGPRNGQITRRKTATLEDFLADTAAAPNKKPP